MINGLRADLDYLSSLRSYSIRNGWDSTINNGDKVVKPTINHPQYYQNWVINIIRYPKFMWATALNNSRLGM